MDNNQPEFKLVATLYSELDANALKAHLEAAGIAAKINPVNNRTSHYLLGPDTFGVYVEESRVSEARDIFTQMTMVGQPIPKVHKAVKIYSFALLGGLLVFLGYLILQMLKFIYS